MNLQQRINAAAKKEAARLFELFPKTSIRGRMIVPLSLESVEYLVKNSMVDGAALVAGIIGKTNQTEEVETIIVRETPESRARNETSIPLWPNPDGSWTAINPELTGQDRLNAENALAERRKAFPELNDFLIQKEKANEITG
jgi:hypothetical protein